MSIEGRNEAKMLFRKLFVVRKCIKCRRPMDVKDFENAFCPECREKYLRAKMAICPECALEANNCRCLPKLLAKDKIIALRRVFFYSKEHSSEPQNKLIYFLKANKSRRVGRFTAGELYLLLRNELSALDDIGDKKPIIVSIPRSRDSLIRYGFDQSALVSRELSSISGFEYCELFRRRRGKAQKSLTAGERRKNIKSSLYINEREAMKIRGRIVVLIDDVVTTGASMSACAQLLYEYGAKNILCIAIASDIKS